jgi:peptidoglycan hydrolase CwlO-like protein
MGLSTCDDGHDDICYMGGTCPACAIADELKSAENESKELEKERDQLSERVSDLESKLEEAEKDLSDTQDSLSRLHAEVILLRESSSDE